MKTECIIRQLFHCRCARPVCTGLRGRHRSGAQHGHMSEHHGSQVEPILRPVSIKRWLNLFLLLFTRFLDSYTRQVRYRTRCQICNNVCQIHMILSLHVVLNCRVTTGQGKVEGG